MILRSVMVSGRRQTARDARSMQAAGAHAGKPAIAPAIPGLQKHIDQHRHQKLQHRRNPGHLPAAAGGKRHRFKRDRADPAPTGKQAWQIERHRNRPADKQRCGDRR